MSKDFSSLIENEEFIEAIALKIAKDTKLQTIILEAIIKNVATKEDIRELRYYIDVRIGDLDKRIDGLDKRIDGLDKRIDSLDKRIDALDKRISVLQWITVLGFMLVSVITAIIQFIAMSLK
ncbi:MAG: hypothetical protein ACP6IU_08320 [Candidatus Asgardarchaeia archaeon]